jgi:hypothetical protein
MNEYYRGNLSLVTSTLRSTATEDGSAPTREDVFERTLVNLK